MGGLVVGSLAIALAVVLEGGHKTETTGAGAGQPGPPAGTGGGTGGGGPVGDQPIPGVGGDVFLAGGLARVPVPAGWHVVSRGDRSDSPGGYSESAVVTDPSTGITLGIYLLPGTTSPAAAASTASDVARVWTRDGKNPHVDPAQPASSSGQIAGAATARYRYDQSAPREGELLIAVRSDGVTLAVFVDAREGTLDASRATWERVRNDIVAGFGG